MGKWQSRDLTSFNFLLTKLTSRWFSVNWSFGILYLWISWSVFKSKTSNWGLQTELSPIYPVSSTHNRLHSSILVFWNKVSENLTIFDFDFTHRHSENWCNCIAIFPIALVPHITRIGCDKWSIRRSDICHNPQSYGHSLIESRNCHEHPWGSISFKKKLLIDLKNGCGSGK